MCCVKLKVGLFCNPLYLQWFCLGSLLPPLCCQLSQLLPSCLRNECILSQVPPQYPVCHLALPPFHLEASAWHLCAAQGHLRTPQTRLVDPLDFIPRTPALSLLGCQATSGRADPFLVGGAPGGSEMAVPCTQGVGPAAEAIAPRFLFALVRL